MKSVSEQTQWIMQRGFESLDLRAKLNRRKKHLPPLLLHHAERLSEELRKEFFRLIALTVTNRQVKKARKTQ